jgi:hypothetical protein
MDRRRDRRQLAHRAVAAKFEPVLDIQRHGRKDERDRRRRQQVLDADLALQRDALRADSVAARHAFAARIGAAEPQRHAVHVPCARCPAGRRSARAGAPRGRAPSGLDLLLGKRPASSSVGPLRLPKFGSAIACCMFRPQSSVPTSTLAT